MTEGFEGVGLRVLRPLVRDARRELLLAHVDDPADGEPAVVVVRRCLVPSEVPRQYALSEVLDRARGAGVVELIDLTDDLRAPALILARLEGRSLGDILARRTRLGAGEATGVLAPLVATLARLHDAGVAHGRLAPRHVIVGEAGVTLTGLADAELLPADAPEVVRAPIAAIARDREATRAWAIELLGLVDGSRSRAAQTLASRLASVDPAELLTALGEGIADLAAPLPVHAEDPPTEPAPMPLVTMPLVAKADTAAPPDEPPAGRDDAGSAAGWRDELVSRGRAALSELRRRLDELPALRRRALLGGGGAVVIAAVLWALVPAGDHGTAAEGVAPAPSVRSASTSAPTPAGDETAGDETAGDDPIAAATVLLARREDCFRELSVLCLEGVDQAGSAALADDRAVVAEMRAGGEGSYPSATGAPRLVERLGATALLDVGTETAPASLLVMRGEAGWRIRDWIAGAG